MEISKLAMLNEKMFNHIYRGEYEQVKECLDNGADVNAKERFGNSTLISALGCGHTKIAKLLIERGADINAVNDKGFSVLDSLNSLDALDLANIESDISENHIRRRR